MRYSTIISIVLLLSVSWGCSSDTSSRTPVYKVKGKVTYNGQPAASADLIFTPSEGQKGAFGRSDENGEYELTTYSSSDGAVEGKYAVAILQVPLVADTPAIASIDSEEYQPPGIGESTMPVAQKTTLPEKYADSATSGLIAVVNADNENVINFDLKD